MDTYTAALTIDRPRDEVYDRLQRFETYPAFMDSADEVRRDGDRLHWRMSLGPVTREYEARITAEEPGERIAWRTDEDDVQEAGEFRLTDAGEGATDVRLEASYDLDSAALQFADAVDFLEKKVEDDLRHLKEYLEKD
ncbi:SRPBCC family protein [Egicoccus halophilus]|nr:SRPBCC family protein [Egicoccus halophilus]